MASRVPRARDEAPARPEHDRRRQGQLKPGLARKRQPTSKVPCHGQHGQRQRQHGCNDKADLEALIFRLLRLGLGIIGVGRGIRFRNDGVVALLAHGVAQGLGTGLPGIVAHGGPGSAEVHAGRGDTRRPAQGVLDTPGATGTVHAQQGQVQAGSRFRPRLLDGLCAPFGHGQRFHEQPPTISRTEEIPLCILYPVLFLSLTKDSAMAQDQRLIVSVSGIRGIIGEGLTPAAALAFASALGEATGGGAWC